MGGGGDNISIMKAKSVQHKRREGATYMSY